jgi:hypothetical protein
MARLTIIMTHRGLFPFEWDQMMYTEQNKHLFTQLDDVFRAFGKMPPREHDATIIAWCKNNPVRSL